MKTKLHPEVKSIITRSNMQIKTFEVVAPENIRVGKINEYIYTLMTSTKAKKFRAGFMKKNGEYRVGKFDLLNRSTWKQTDGTMYKRKGKTRTTKADEYILAHDLDKKAPRNISVARLKWFSVGKKVYKINRLELNNTITIAIFEKVKFNHLKLLMKKGDIE
jgi:hypothetical protein